MSYSSHEHLLQEAESASMDHRDDDDEDQSGDSKASVNRSIRSSGQLNRRVELRTQLDSSPPPPPSRASPWAKTRFSVVVSPSSLFHMEPVLTHYGGPIDGVPDDVLRDIFLLCLPPNRWRIRPSSATPPVLLSHVCSRWRALAIASPLLWNTQTVKLQSDGAIVEIVNCLLSRALPSPVNLCIHRKEIVREVSPIAPPPILEPEGRYLTRLVLLTLPFPLSPPCLLPTVKRPLWHQLRRNPSLHQLSLGIGMLPCPVTLLHYPFHEPFSIHDKADIDPTLQMRPLPALQFARSNTKAVACSAKGPRVSLPGAVALVQPQNNPFPYITAKGCQQLHLVIPAQPVAAELCNTTQQWQSNGPPGPTIHIAVDGQINIML
ncbi:hypothetical protein NMY22_g16959 [Coprinellus aureogranulatus]|nr:hypothetical protein NMY22_g16959 [Coprinellus aureogranulatus]